MSTEADSPKVKPRSHMYWCGHEVLGMDLPIEKRLIPGVLIYARPVSGMGWSQPDPADLIGAPPYYNGRAHKIDAEGALLPPKFMRPVYWMVNPDQIRVIRVKIDRQPAIVAQIYRVENMSEDMQMMQTCKMVYTLARACGYSRFAVSLKSPTQDPFGEVNRDKGSDFPAAMNEEDEAALERALQEMRNQKPGIVVADGQDEAKMVEQAKATAPELRIVR